MRELVSRQIVLAEVREWFDQRGIDGEHLLAVLEQIPSESGWICVEERLPEYGRYLVFVRKESGRSAVQTATFNNMGWWMYANFGEITHWMPLPEPPKEE